MLTMAIGAFEVASLGRGAGGEGHKGSSGGGAPSQLRGPGAPSHGGLGLELS